MRREEGALAAAGAVRRPLHVGLIFFDPFTPGGVQSQIAGRIEHLGFPGGPVRFTLLASKPPAGGDPWPHVRREIAAGWERFSIAVYEYTAARGIATALERVHRADPFDVVELHAGGAGPAVGAWCRKRAVPLVCVAHSLKFFSHRDDGQRWEVHRYYAWANRKAFRFAERVVAVSGAIGRELTRFGVPAEKIIVMHTATRAEEGAGSGRVPPAGKDGLRMLFVGRSSPEKGLDVLLDALDSVRRRGLAVSLEIIGAWGGDDGLARRAREQGLPAEFLGPRSPAATRRAIAETDLLLIPSRYDACPVVAAEGLAAGALILASDAGGIPEIVRNGRTGIVVPIGDPAALARAIEDVSRDPSQFIGLRKAAREASREFLWETRAPEILRLYREVAEA